MDKFVPLKEHTTYKIGGPAAYFVEAKTTKDIKKAIDEWKNIGGDMKDVFVLGGGANVLFPDKGFDGLVMKISFDGIKEIEPGVIEAGSGVPMKDVVEFAAANGLSGLEWAAGLPGSFGGAIRGNAGAFRGEMKDFVTEVKSIKLSDPMTVMTRDVSECGFDYRTSRYKKEDGEIVISAVMKLTPGDEKNIRDEMDGYVKYREDHQPLEYPSAGSTFKNVDADLITEKQREDWVTVIKNDPFPVVPVAFLLSEAGLKGKRIGGAMISEKHPNFFINYDNATADDIKKLVLIAKEEVKKRFNIDIEPEIQIVG
ncbi:MAG: UDP-N-acetylmuramate dehydrogenase [Candidatus Omnitrophica bacterium]|jgi:UDP-N-acetylmuramate dehydrogenase|nr:UDP-N-acetylmuramate dehydrogenase [Candidatus Omnitrophota bacterium]